MLHFLNFLSLLPSVFMNIPGPSFIPDISICLLAHGIWHLALTPDTRHLVPAPRPWQLAVVRDFALAPNSGYVVSIHHAIGQEYCPGVGNRP